MSRIEPQKSAKSAVRSVAMVLLPEALAAKGWSQNELERRIGSGKGVVTRWATGHKTPMLEAVIAIRDLLGIPVDAWVVVATSTRGKLLLEQLRREFAAAA